MRSLQSLGVAFLAFSFLAVSLSHGQAGSPPLAAAICWDLDFDPCTSPLPVTPTCFQGGICKVTNVTITTMDENGNPVEVTSIGKGCSQPNHVGLITGPMGLVPKAVESNQPFAHVEKEEGGDVVCAYTALCTCHLIPLEENCDDSNEIVEYKKPSWHPNFESELCPQEKPEEVR